MAEGSESSRRVVARWVSGPTEAYEVCAEISRYPVVGYDSEFYGVDISRQSCVGTAVVDVFSFATPAGDLNALGFNEPNSYVFDGALLTHPSVRAIIENPAVMKAVHNLPVDAHAAQNAGVAIRNGLNTLDMARWIYPERANLLHGCFDLDSLARWRVGRGKTEDFSDFLMYDALEEVTELSERKFCGTCQLFSCRKQKSPHDHKVTRETMVTRNKKVRLPVHLPDVRPDASRADLFARYLTYAAVDAELALIMLQMMERDGRKARRYPWSI